MILLKNQTSAELARALADLAPPERLVRQLHVAAVRRGITELPTEMATVSPRMLRKIRERVVIPRLTMIDKVVSPRDGFAKYLFQGDGEGKFEAVRIPLLHRPDDLKYVVCVSSQVGCGLGCVFCATGRMGFQRNLATWEIVAGGTQDMNPNAPCRKSGHVDSSPWPEVLRLLLAHRFEGRDRLGGELRRGARLLHSIKTEYVTKNLESWRLESSPGYRLQASMCGSQTQLQVVMGVANFLSHAITRIVEPGEPNLLDPDLAPESLLAMRKAADVVIVLVRPHDHVDGFTCQLLPDPRCNRLEPFLRFAAVAERPTVDEHVADLVPRREGDEETIAQLLQAIHADIRGNLDAHICPLDALNGGAGD